MPDQLDQPLPDSRLRWLRRTHPAHASRSDGFGRFAEATARFMGSPKFVLYMSIFVAVWIVANLVLAKMQQAWDPYPFILLNLAFSTQASYSAPLIMLAQNRQDDRDRVTAEQDRQRAQRNLEDTEFLTREIAALRLAMNDVATRDSCAANYVTCSARSSPRSASPVRRSPSSRTAATTSPAPPRGSAPLAEGRLLSPRGPRHLSWYSGAPLGWGHAATDS